MINVMDEIWHIENNWVNRDSCCLRLCTSVEDGNLFEQYIRATVRG